MREENIPYYKTEIERIQRRLTLPTTREHDEDTGTVSKILPLMPEQSLLDILTNAIKNSEVELLEYLLLSKDKWICLKQDDELNQLVGLDDETRDTLFQQYVNENIKRSFIQRLEDQLLLLVNEQYAAKNIEEKLSLFAKKQQAVADFRKQAARLIENQLIGRDLEKELLLIQQDEQNAKKTNEEKNEQREIALKIIKFAASDQRRRDQTRYVAKSVASVAGVIIFSAISVAVCAIAAPVLIPIGVALSAVIGGTAAWIGFGKLIGAGTAKVSSERLAIAPGADWGAIIGFAVGVAISAVLGVVIPGAGVFLGIAAGDYIGGAIGATVGCAIGCAGSYQIAKKIKHTTSKVVTNIATALGSIVGGFAGAAIGSVFFPGLGTVIGMAIGAAVGGSLFGAGTFLKLRKETNVNTQLDVPRKMAAAGGIVGACTGSGIGAVIGTFIFPGIGTVIGAAIGAVVGMAAISTASYKAAQSTQSKTQVVMGVTGAIGGAKIAGMLGAGIGGVIGFAIGGPVGLVVGAGLGIAIGAAIGAASVGLYRAFFGRFAKKDPPAADEEPSKKPENAVHDESEPRYSQHVEISSNPQSTPSTSSKDALITQSLNRLLPWNWNKMKKKQEEEKKREGEGERGPHIKQ